MPRIIYKTNTQNPCFQTGFYPLILSRITDVRCSASSIIESRYCEYSEREKRISVFFATVLISLFMKIAGVLCPVEFCVTIPSWIDKIELNSSLPICFTWFSRRLISRAGAPKRLSTLKRRLILSIRPLSSLSTNSTELKAMRWPWKAFIARSFVETSLTYCKI